MALHPASAIVVPSSWNGLPAYENLRLSRGALQISKDNTTQYVINDCTAKKKRKTTIKRNITLVICLEIDHVTKQQKSALRIE